MASKRSKAPEGANGSAGSTDEIALAIAQGTGGPAPTGSAASGGSAGGRPNLRSLTLTALLGVFILAVVVAVLRHFLPGRFSSLVGRAMERADKD